MATATAFKVVISGDARIHASDYPFHTLCNLVWTARVPAEAIDKVWVNCGSCRESLGWGVRKMFEKDPF